MATAAANAAKTGRKDGMKGGVGWYTGFWEGVIGQATQDHLYVTPRRLSPPITTFPRPVSVHMEGILRVSVWFVWRVSVYTVNGCVSEVTWEYCCLIAAPVCGKFRM